jgi:hypothetical protein
VTGIEVRTVTVVAVPCATLEKKLQQFFEQRQNLLGIAIGDAANYVSFRANMTCWEHLR